MSAIAFDLPDDVAAIRDGVLRFVDTEIVPRVENNRALFEDQRKLYDENGRYSVDVQRLIRETRTLSASAGFFAMCAPEELGGAGFGHLAYYVAWEAINRRLGSHTVLTPWVIAHWAFGPSRVLTEVTPDAAKRCLAGMMSGETSMCFGLSEPGAGSDASMLKTRAVRTDKGWRITGRKLWTTNSPTPTGASSSPSPIRPGPSAKQAASARFWCRPTRPASASKASSSCSATPAATKARWCWRTSRSSHGN
jgi:acyl-CoA dehydrogenase